MKLRLLVGILVFLIIVNVAAIGTFLYVNFSKPEKGPRPGGPFGDKHFKRDHPLAKLSEEERQELFDHMRDFRESTRERFELTHQLEDEIFELMQAEPVATAQVDSLLEEIAAIRLQVAKDATRHMIEVRKDLTPEQREVLRHMMMRMRPGMGGPHGGPPGFDGRRPPKDRRKGR